MERVAYAARADTAIRSAAFDALDDRYETGASAWDLMDTPPSSVEAIRDDINALKERLAQAAPRRAVQEMDRAISLLNRQMEDMRTSGDAARSQDNAAVEAELRKLKAALDADRSPARFQALAAGVEVLARKLDSLAAKTVNPMDIARIQRQTDEMKALATRALAPGGLKDIAVRIAKVAEAVERRVSEASEAFTQSAEALIAKVKQLEASYVLGGQSNADELRRDIRTEIGAIATRMDKMGEQIAGLSPAVSGAFAARLDVLLTRIERADSLDKAALAPITEAMDRHMAGLTDRVRDTQTRLNRLDSIEAALDRVTSEMGRLREATLSAPVEAAHAVAMKMSKDEDGAAVVGLKRGLAALEARQEELERRAGLWDEAEAELQDLSTDLGRTAHDGNLWMPQDAMEADADGEWEEFGEAEAAPEHAPAVSHAPAAAPHPAEPAREAPRPEPVQAAPSASPKAGPQAQPQVQPKAAAHAGPNPQAVPKAGASAGGPRAPEVTAEGRKARPRRVRLEPAPELHAQSAVSEAEAEAQRAAAARRVNWTVGHREGQPRERKALFGMLLGSRQAMLLTLLAGAAGMMLMSMAAVLVFQHGSGLVSGVTASVSSLFSPVRDLPSPVGPSALRTAAFSGDLAAAYAVGVRYADGDGTKPDAKAAEKWLAYAVAGGSAPAAYRLGSLYENETHNLKEAQRFYEWAAEQGNVRAMHNLGVLYSQGVDGKPDWPNAIKWFRKSAESGQTDSQYNLGVIYARGLSGRTDSAEAWKWFALAASQGDADSASKRDSIAERAEPAGLDRAKQEVASFRPQPLDPNANTVAMRPEWETSAAGRTASLAAGR